jgi:FKBP-type peptidyl-prolyl cis-trans isomerase
MWRECGENGVSPCAAPEMLVPIVRYSVYIMKPVFLFTALSLAMGLATSNLHAQAATAPKSQKEKLSYAIGMDIGQTLKKQSIDVDPQFLSSAIKDSLTGAAPQLTEDQMREVLTTFANEMKSKQMAAMAKTQDAAKAAAPENLKKGVDFLAANKSKPGVQTLPDGLQYKVVKEGTGPMPTAADKVSVNYTGTLIDGTVFDSSKGTPVSFGVGQVIKGWTEILQKMKVGSKYQVFIPSELAYGESGTPGGPIGPNSALIFDVELLGITK